MIPPVTVVVPLAPPHDHLVPRLIAQLAPDRNLIEKVVLARSSARSGQIRHLISEAEKAGHEYGLTIHVLASRRRKLAGPNRNRGWRCVTTEFTAFLDADDLYVSNRIARILDVARSEDSDLILHAFSMNAPDDGPLPDDSWTSDDLVRTDALYAATFEKGRDRAREGSSPGDTNILIPQVGNDEAMAHHGHVFVKTLLREQFQYGNLYPGEDGQFCRDVLWSGRTVTFIPARLSAYQPHLSAERHAGILLKGRRRGSKWAARLVASRNSSGVSS